MAGLGNPLMGDDGIGSAVIDRLRARELPVGMRTTEVGSDVSRLGQIWEGESAIWLVDAMDVQQTPGTILRVFHNQLLNLPGGHSSVHHLSAPENLRWLIHGFPDLRSVQFNLWGVVPESIAQRPTLTAAVERAADDLVRQILQAWELEGPGASADPV